MKITAKDHIHFFRSEDIVRFESGHEGVVIFFRNGHTEIIRSDIDRLAEEIEEQGFVRVHPAHIINVNQIARIPEMSTDMVELENGDIIPILPNTREQLITLLKDHI